MESRAAKKVLVVDDELALVRMISQVLTQQGFKVLEANSGQEALRILFTEKPDLVLLDVVMPGIDGWQTCSRIRDVSDVPIIVLTGKRNTEEDVVRGLDAGADEYLSKPVGNRELVARVRAALRRTELATYKDKKERVVFNDNYLSVDVTERRILAKGERVRLTPREFRLLALLLGNAGKVITHREVLEKVWGWEYIDDVDYVRIYISHLRQKIEPEPNQPKYILTEPGTGYYFSKAS